ncbi:MAG: type II and III secretion system protein family protein [Rhizomicrobium sp.]
MKRAVLFIIALLLAANPACAQSNAEVARVATGGQYLIELPARATRLALGDPSLVDVKLLASHQIRLLGLKPGTTDLMVWMKGKTQSFAIVVGPNVAALSSALSNDPEMAHAAAVATPQGVTLQGDVPSLEMRVRAQHLAQSQNGKAIDNDLAVDDRRMVALEIRFAAVSTNTMKALGLNFQKLGGGFQFASGVPGSISSVQFNPLNIQSSLPLSQAFSLLMNWPGADFSTVISALSSVNLAELLAQPTLMVRSGDEASFLAGGEIPIPVTQSGQSMGAISIEYRKFGVQLHVRATVLSEDRIVLKVNPEVSELDYQDALTLQGFNVPAIRVRATDTTIELGNGQSFVLAGLMYSSHSNIEEKVPGLGSLPVIGDFFKRSQNSGQEQELVIVATPRLVSPMKAVPKLPGEGIAYRPSLAQTLLNTTDLGSFAAEYGLVPP